MPKLQMICETCGSINVFRDAWAAWNVEAQNWECSAVFDHAVCDECDGDTRIEEVEYNEECEERENYFTTEDKE
jgi:hypothetical protein